MSPGPGEQMTRRVVAIIQARMGSARLPGKILADIAGRPMIWRVVNRVRMAQTVDHVVVATTTGPADDEVAAYCLGEGIACFRGSEDDVLDRYYQAARQFRADVVIRVTADCPFIDPGVIDHIVTAFGTGDCDYATNVIRYTYPHGLDTEVFSFAALEAAWHEAKQPSEREHVTPYIRNTPGRFRRLNVENETDLSGLQLRWTVDEPADLAFARACYASLGDLAATFGFRDLVALLEREPSLRAINQTVRGHEGYFKSLAEDEPIAPLYPLAPLPVGQEAPLWLQSGAGCRVWDRNGREYVDTHMLGGTAILGHAHPAVVAAIRQAEGSLLLSPHHPFASAVAELLLGVVPGAELVSLTGSGTSAAQAAADAARRYTNKGWVLFCTAGRRLTAAPFPGSVAHPGAVPGHVVNSGAVGSSGALGTGTPPHANATPASPGETFGSLAVGAGALAAAVDQYAGRLAAIWVEPFGDEQAVALLLREARALADQEGALLILDERRTAFRLAPGGAAAFFGVRPDLIVMGEAMANGYPLGAVVGRRALVQAALGAPPEGLTTTALAAATATLPQVCQPEVSAEIRGHGLKWRNGLNVLARAFGLGDRVQAEGLVAHSVVSFVNGEGAPDPLLAARFAQECLRRGVFFTGVQAVSVAHTVADVERVLRVYRSALADLSPISSDDYPR